MGIGGGQTAVVEGFHGELSGVQGDFVGGFQGDLVVEGFHGELSGVQGLLDVVLDSQVDLVVFGFQGELSGVQWVFGFVGAPCPRLPDSSGHPTMPGWKPPTNL